VLLLALLVASPGRAQPCPGDCAGRGTVAVSDIVTCVGLALRGATPAACSACDLDGDQRVAVHELIRAVGSSLNGCPPPVATPTRTARATPTATPPGGATVLGVGRSAQAGLGAALAVRDALALLAAALEAALVENPSALCPGSVTTSCERRGGASARTVTYDACVVTTAEGRRVVRDGDVIETVVTADDAAFCSSGAAAVDTVVEIELRAYRQRETIGELPVAAVDANLHSRRRPVGNGGCAGPDVEHDEVTGEIEGSCTTGARSLACPLTGAEATLVADGLRLTRLSGGFPCARLHLADGPARLGGAAAPAAIALDGFRVEDTDLLDGGGVTVAIDGTVQADCPGALAVRTDPERPLQFPVAATCPADGTLTIGRSGGTDEGPQEAGAAATVAGAEDASGADALGAEPGTPGDGMLRQHLYRSESGLVYQVLQNDGAARSLGAEAVRITTLVGSSASVAECANAADASSDPQAVSAAAAGQALPIDGVMKSGLLPGSAVPCFNRNAEGGAGRICIGRECASDCRCPEAGECRSFTRAQGAPLSAPAAEVPAAELDPSLAALSDPCSGFEGRATYRFGLGGPTTQSALCGPAPRDGFALPNGHSIVVVYGAAPLALVNAGYGGFPVDLDGQNLVGCSGTGGVLNAGVADQATAAGARIEFAGGSASFDYDGDGTIDRRQTGCGREVFAECQIAPPPTPTPDPVRPCAAAVLESADRIEAGGTTADQPDHAGGVPCGFGGGNGAPDAVFEYVAPAEGSYEIQASGTGFAPNLYARANSCLPDEEPFGCQDDGDGDGRASLLLRLAAAQRVAIVVDGVDVQAGGDFTLAVERLLPDLMVTGVTAPDEAIAGLPVTLAVEVTNAGRDRSAPSRVLLFFARDRDLRQPLGAATVGCALPSLAPGASAECRPTIDLIAPPVAEGSYFVGAVADSDGAIREADETNNAQSSAVDITVLGSRLEQRLFQADDLTLYQVVRAVPIAAPSESELYRVVALAAADVPIESQVRFFGELACIDTGPVLQSGFARPPGLTRRTGVVLPADSTLAFDAAGSGRLVLGSGTVREVCREASRCAPDSEPLTASAAGDRQVPAACAGIVDDCDRSADHTVLAFGRPSENGLCADRLTELDAIVCDPPPSEGFPLLPGQAVVFVYEIDPEEDLDSLSFDAGLAGFGVDLDGSNLPDCPIGTVVEAIAAGASIVPTNDECAGAVEVVASPGFIHRVGTRGATMGAEDPSDPCGGATEASVWYRYTAPATDVTVTVTADGADAIGIYEGGCDALRRVSPCLSPPNRVAGQTLAGGRTYFVVSSHQPGFAHDQVDLFFNVRLPTPTRTPGPTPTPPVNDICAGAVDIAPSALPFSASAFTAGITADPNDPLDDCPIGVNFGSLWYRLTAPAGGLELEAEAVGSDLLTNLVALRGSCDALTTVDCGSLQRVSLAAGETLYLLLASRDGEDRTLVLNVRAGPTRTPTPMRMPTPTPPRNDFCASAIEIEASDLPFTDTVGTAGAGAGGVEPAPACFPGPPHNSVWYRFTVPDGGMVLDADTLGSDYDTVLTAFEGPCGTLDPVACNDDVDPPADRRSRLDSVAAREGQPVYFRVSSALPDTGGNLMFSLRQGVAATPTPTPPDPPANDECGAAVEIAALPFSQGVDARSATTDPDDPIESCGPVTGRSVWYRFTAPAGGIRLQLDTIGSDAPTVVAVYTGQCGRLEERACRSLAFGGQPVLSALDLSGGETVLIGVTTFASADPGFVQLNVAVSLGTPTPTVIPTATPPPPPPANDACEAAVEVSLDALPFNHVLDTTSATTDDGDPVPSCGQERRNRSVWYRATAPTGGIVVAVDTMGSTYDTILSAYTGTCGSLAPLPSPPASCNDDFEGPQSLLDGLLLSSSQTYYFLVTSFGSSSGSLRFTVQEATPNGNPSVSS
jgi:hypothetical protein